MNRFSQKRVDSAIRHANFGISVDGCVPKTRMSVLFSAGLRWSRNSHGEVEKSFAHPVSHRQIQLKPRFR